MYFLKAKLSNAYLGFYVHMSVLKTIVIGMLSMLIFSCFDIQVLYEILMIKTFFRRQTLFFVKTLQFLKFILLIKKKNVHV